MGTELLCYLRSNHTVKGIYSKCSESPFFFLFHYHHNLFPQTQPSTVENKARTVKSSITIVRLIVPKRASEVWVCNQAVSCLRCPRSRENTGSNRDTGECARAPWSCLLKLMEGLAFQQPLHWDTRQTAPLDPWLEGPLFWTSLKAQALASYPWANGGKIRGSYPEAKEKPSLWKDLGVEDPNRNGRPTRNKEPREPWLDTGVRPDTNKSPAGKNWGLLPRRNCPARYCRGKILGT